MTTTAVYAGSFDPVTKGHLDLIERARVIFPKVIVGIGINPAKKPMFSFDERVGMIRDSLRDPGQVEVMPFKGLLVDFCTQVGATVIIRGLRAVTDFEAEMGLAHTNRNLDDKIDTFFLPTQPQHSFISSSTVRELAKMSLPDRWANLERYVTQPVLMALQAKQPWVSP